MRWKLIMACVFGALLGACTAPLRIQSDDVPAGALRVGQVVTIAKRADLVGNEVYGGLLAAGIPDAEITDGSVVLVRIYCCGGMTPELSAEYANRRMAYVPHGISLQPGDFVEIRVGQPPQAGTGGQLNTVTRVAAAYGSQPETCWWEPRNDKLWLRIVFCSWMPGNGWIKQGGLSPAWYLPAAPR